MRKTTVALLAVAAFALSAAVAAAADVKIGVNIAVPAPPPLVLAPPRLAVVAGTPVHHVPSASFNLFVYQNRYYSLHNGTWFVSTAPRAPWAPIALEAVPKPILAVPVKHYKIPPGHAKKMGARDSCPPGQAKKGRC